MARRSGFTMIELLVSVSIIVILAGLTIAVVSNTMNSDRIRSSARGVQSALAGARDRALRAGRNHDPADPNPLRGLRFIVNDPPIATGINTVSSMVYVRSLPPWSDGQAQLVYDQNGLPRRVRGSADGSGLLPKWVSLNSQGLIPTGARIQFNGDGNWYSVASVGSDVIGEKIELSVDYLTPLAPSGVENDNAANLFTSYKVELANAVLPGEQPISLASGIVINLSQSPAKNSLPALLPGPPQYFDVMFSSRGTVAGSLASRGLIHLYLSNIEDVIKGVDPANAQSGDKIVSTIFTQTGNVGTFPVDVTDQIVNATGSAGTDNLADDPFSFARRGKVAGR